MGCGKAVSKASVDEPLQPRKVVDEWTPAAELTCHVDVQASSALRSTASYASDAPPKDQPGPRAAVLSEGDFALRLPQPPLPPSVAAHGQAALPAVPTLPVVVSAAPGREAEEAAAVEVVPPSPAPFVEVPVKTVVQPHGDLLKKEDGPKASVPLTDTASLRAIAAATSETGFSAPASFDMPGQPEVPRPQETGPVPGAICTTPRGFRASHKSSIEHSLNSGIADSSENKSLPVGKAHVDKAFAGFGTTSATHHMDIDSALAMLDAVVDHAEDAAAAGISPVAPKWPSDVFVAPGSRVLVLTWARWARNSLRIKEEKKLKALQHVRYPKVRQLPPLSPQPTPRAGDSGDQSARAQGSQGGGSLRQEPLATAAPIAAPPPDAPIAAPPPSRGGGKRHPAMAPRGRSANGASTDGRLLFDVMADERREAQEAQAVKKKLQKNFAIEDAHTMESGKTPGFGVETPSWGTGGNTGGTASRMSPLESMVSSGVASPMAGGQMSPWLLEAEALVNGEDDVFSPEHHVIPTASAWGFEPARLPEVPEVGELNVAQTTPEELDDFIGDEDELDQVGIFNTAGISPGALGSDGQQFSPELLGTDSLASTATSLKAPHTSTQSCTNSEKETLPGKATGLQASANPTEYAVGEKVSYWSGSKGVYLLAVIVEKKSSNVYVIDKQMKGCLAKVRRSDLISVSEEKRDPVLRALAAFGSEQKSESRSGTPRGRGGSPRTGGSPRSDRGTPRSEHGIPRDRGGSSQRPPRQGDTWLPPPQTSSIQAALPPALAGFAGPTSKSPRSRGKIVRDDFSDDSDDD